MIDKKEGKEEGWMDEWAFFRGKRRTRKRRSSSWKGRRGGRAGCQFSREAGALAKREGRGGVVRGYVGGGLYIAAMLSANTRVRPIYPKGWGGGGGATLSSGMNSARGPLCGSQPLPPPPTFHRDSSLFHSSLLELFSSPLLLLLFKEEVISFLLVEVWIECFSMRNFVFWVVYMYICVFVCLCLRVWCASLWEFKYSSIRFSSYYSLHSFLI